MIEVVFEGGPADGIVRAFPLDSPKSPYMEFYRNRPALAPAAYEMMRDDMGPVRDAAGRYRFSFIQPVCTACQEKMD